LTGYGGSELDNFVSNQQEGRTCKLHFDVALLGKRSRDAQELMVEEMLLGINQWVSQLHEMEIKHDEMVANEDLISTKF
jgi:hypothetical protein